MKKILLSVMSVVLLSAGGANAQNAGDIRVAAASAGVESVQPLKSADKAVGPKKIKADEMLFGFPASNAGYYNVIGFPSVPTSQLVAAQITVPSSLVGYQILGLRFSVAASVGTNEPFVFAYTFNDTDDMPTQQYADINIKDYEVSTISGNKLDLKYNDVYFTEPHTVTTSDQAIRYGYSYTQSTDETSADSKPIICYESDDSKLGSADVLFLGFGKFGTSGEGWYNLARITGDYTPLIMIIAKDTKGETAIIGVNGEKASTAKQYYTLDGKQLPAPQKGLNIVKMSDGTTAKVVVK